MGRGGKKADPDDAQISQKQVDRALKEYERITSGYQTESSRIAELLQQQQATASQQNQSNMAQMLRQQQLTRQVQAEQTLAIQRQEAIAANAQRAQLAGDRKLSSYNQVQRGLAQSEQSKQFRLTAYTNRQALLEVLRNRIQ